MRPPHDAKAGLYQTSNQCEPFFIHNPIAKHPAPTTIHRSAVIFCYYMCPHLTICVSSYYYVSSSYRHNAIATHTYTKMYIPRPLQYIEAHYTQGSFFFNFLFLAAITPAPRPGSIGTASWRQAFWPRYAGCASPKSVQPCGAAR